MPPRTGAQILGDLKKQGITGLKELDRKLAKLQDDQYRKVVRKASSKSMTPLTRAMRAKAPVDEGDLKKSIGKRTKQYRRAGVIFTVAGPRRATLKAAATKTATANYGHLVEFGHRIASGGTLKRTDGRAAGRSKVTGKKGKGKVTGFVPPVPFMRPAWDEKAKVVEQTYIRELSAGVAMESKKA